MYIRNEVIKIPQQHEKQVRPLLPSTVRPLSYVTQLNSVNQSMVHFCMQKIKCLFNRNNVLEHLWGRETWVSWLSIPQRGNFACCAKSSVPIQHALVRKVHRKEIQWIGLVKTSWSPSCPLNWIQVMLSLLGWLQQTLLCRDPLHKELHVKTLCLYTGFWFLSNRISRCSISVFS